MKRNPDPVLGHFIGQNDHLNGRIFCSSISHCIQYVKLNISVDFGAFITIWTIDSIFDTVSHYYLSTWHVQNMTQADLGTQFPDGFAFWNKCLGRIFVLCELNKFRLYMDFDILTDPLSVWELSCVEMVGTVCTRAYMQFDLICVHFPHFQM